jgi:type VI secretion system protein ImpK
MRAEIARLVFPVFTTGIQRKRDLLTGPLDFDVVQRELVGLLQASTQAAAWVHPGRFEESFLGVPYPLTCWLDEVFTADDSPWRERWANQSLEWELFNSQNRAFQFWEQSAIARKLAEPDALEVFYLCVVLGFRGTARDAPEGAGSGGADAPQGGDVKRWCDEMKEQIDRARANTPGPPESVKPPSDVGLLEGARSFHTMLTAWAVCLFFVTPCIGYFILLPLFWFLDKNKGQ